MAGLIVLIEIKFNPGDNNESKKTRKETYSYSSYFYPLYWIIGGCVDGIPGASGKTSPGGTTGSFIPSGFNRAPASTVN